MTSTARLVDDSGNELLAFNRDNGTAYPTMRSLELGLPTTRDSSSLLSGQDGELDLTALTGGRAITADVLLPGTDPATQVAFADQLRGLMHPGRRYYLHVQMDGWQAERRIRVRGASLSLAMGPIPWVAQLGWKAPKPAFQAVTPTTATLNPAAQPTGGFTLPMTLPVALDPGLIPGAVTLSVGGNVSAMPTFDIYGPCSAPMIEVVPSGATLSFPSLTIAQGDYLHVDVAARTITLNSDPSQSRYSSLDFSTASWPSLPAGSTGVVFSPQSSSPGCQAVVTWSDSWI